MIHALVLSLLAFNPDAGIYSKCVEAPQLVPVMPCAYGVCRVVVPPGTTEPQAVPLDWPEEFGDETTGLLMSKKRSERLACFIGACESHRLSLVDAHMNEDTTPVPWQFWAGGLVTAILLTVAAVELKPDWFGLHR